MTQVLFFYFYSHLNPVQVKFQLISEGFPQIP